MAKSWQFAVVSLGPGLLVGSGTLCFAAVSAYLLGNCDSKLGCDGGVVLIAFLGGVGLVLSAIGFSIGCFVHRAALRTFTARRVAVTTLLLSVWVAALLFALPYWAFSVLGTGFIWVLATAAAGWIVVTAVCRLAPSNSFKPKPLRGSA